MLGHDIGHKEEDRLERVNYGGCGSAVWNLWPAFPIQGGDAMDLPNIRFDSKRNSMVWSIQPRGPERERIRKVAEEKRA